MDWSGMSPELRFERRPRAVPYRLIAVGVALAVFTLLWFFVDHGSLFWLLLFLVAVLSWVASYGWRQSLVTLIRLLRYLQAL